MIGVMTGAVCESAGLEDSRVRSGAFGIVEILHGVACRWDCLSSEFLTNSHGGQGGRCSSGSSKS